MNMNRFVPRMEEAGDASGGGGDAGQLAVFASMVGESGPKNDGNLAPNTPSSPEATPATPMPAAPPTTPVVAQPTTPAVVPPATPVAPVPPVVTQPVVPPAPVTQPTLTPPATSVPPTQPEALPPGQPPTDLVAYQATKTRAAEEIASKYQFTPEQALQLATEPEKVLPGLIGRLYVDVFEAVSSLVLQSVPRISYEVNQTTLAAYKREQDFFKNNKDLVDVDRDTVHRFASAYMQLNRQVPADQADKEIGAMIRQALGIAPPVVAPVPGTPAPPVVPGTPVLVARTPLGSSAPPQPPAPPTDATMDALAKMVGRYV